MSDWPTIGAAERLMQDAFGEPVVYQPIQAGFAAGDPVTITAIRHMRENARKPARWRAWKRSQ